MDSPALRAPPLKNSPTRGQSWTPSMSYTLPGMLSMSAAGASSKSFTIGAGGPRIPCTRPAGCLHTRSCLLTPRQQHQLADLFSGEEHVALEVTWSAYQNITWRLPRAQHERGQGSDASRNQHTDLHARTEGPDRTHHTGKDTQTPSRRHPGLLRSSPHHRRSYRSDQRTPRTPTRLRPRIPKPHPLHHPSTPRNRRIQTPTTPSIMKSLFWRRFLSAVRSGRSPARRPSSARDQRTRENREYVARTHAFTCG